MVKTPLVIVREGTHGGYFPGWDPPDCFLKYDALCEKLFVVPKEGILNLKEENEKEEEEIRGRKEFSDYTRVTTQSQRRERSLSRGPKEGKFATVNFEEL
jgi:hypothetical protein